MAHAGTLSGVGCRPSMGRGNRSIVALVRWVRPRRLSSPDGLQAGRPGSVHRTAEHGQARTRERGGRAHEVDPTLGRNRGGFRIQIHILADRQGHPLHLRVPDGPRHDHTQARG